MSERWSEVASEVAPLFYALDDPAPIPELLRRGELVRVGKRRGPMTWEGTLGEAKERRDGDLFEAQRSDGSPGFAFQLDLGGEVPIRPTAAVCDAIAARWPFDAASCKTTLRRARTPDGAILSYAPCASGPCPIALERGSELAAIALTNLTNAHFLRGKTRSVLVAETRYVKEEGKLTGGALTVIALDGPEPTMSPEIPYDQIDARDPARVVSRVVDAVITRAEIRVSGWIEEKSPDGKVLSKKRVQETHALPPMD